MRARHGLACHFLFALVSFALAACGGGGGDSGTPATGTTPPAATAPVNNAPVANAGSDQTVKRKAVVTLDGAASDADGDALAYRWIQTAGAAVTLSSSTAAKPTFTAPADSGNLSFSFVASDGKADSPADSVVVNVENHAPTAAVSTTNMSAALGSMAKLDGSASVDPDGDPLIYKWTQLSGPTVTFTTTAPGVSQFQVPNSPVTLVFALSVSDGEAVSVVINVTINVIVVVQPNQSPIVNVAQANIVKPRRSLVTLNGWAYDPDYADALTYSWEQTAGPTVTLSNANTLYASFTAPATEAQLKFILKASDGKATTTSSPVTVDVKNVAPYFSTVAITPGSPRTQDDLTFAAHVTDADMDPLTQRYEWRRNGTLVASQTSNTFPASLTTRNDVIMARLIANDGFVESVAEATAVIADSPAVLVAQQPPPTDLDYGDSVSFNVLATDADGDAIPGYEVAYGPAGFSVNSQGVVSWTAAGPMFDKVADFNWGVRVAGDQGSLLAGTFKVTDAARLYPVRRTGVQIPIQYSGLKITDLDGDGRNEMLVASPQAVFTMEKSGAAYQQSWAYPFEIFDETTNSSGYDYGFSAITSADVTGDGKQEIFFSKKNLLIRLDGASRREAARRSLQCRALEVADIDRDGSPDLVCLAPSTDYRYDGTAKLVVLDPVTLAEKWSTPTLVLGYTAAVGNVDNDAALEIVTSGGFVFDGQTRQNQWVYGQGFGTMVDTGDLDGDGIEEIVGMGDWSAVRAYSAVSKSPLWEYVPTWNDLDAMTVADANSDGKVEIIVGNGQWGEVMAVGYNASQHGPELLWSINSQNHGVTSIAVGDVDGDGSKEVVWGSGASSSGRDDFVVAGFTPLISVKWKSSQEAQLDGSFVGPMLARLGPGTTRLMYMSPRTNSGYDGMRAIAMDPATGTIKVSNEIGSNWSYGRGFDVVDYDQDGIDELLLGTANTYDGLFAAYDFNASFIEWQSPLIGSSSETVTAVTHGDMNGDGYADLVGITSSGYIYVYDVRSQTLLWKSTGLASSGVDVAVADLDHDGKLEIVAATAGRLFVYGKSGAIYLERANVSGSFTSLVVGDLNGSGAMTISALESSMALTQIRTYDAQLQLKKATSLGVTAAGIYIEDSGDARKNLVVAIQNGTYPYSQPAELWAVDPNSGAEVWHSPSLPGSVQGHTLRFIDLDGDGQKEICFTTSNGMFYTR